LDHRVFDFASTLPSDLKLHVLNEKYLLKQCTQNLIPKSISRRPKQPYRAPEACSFFATKLDYVEELLRPERLREDGIFRPQAVGKLVEKARRGRIQGTKDNMALVGVISTQVWIDRFIRNFRGVN
jgi:asparagine synthase (glutamine-hydrolysing)